VRIALREHDEVPLLEAHGLLAHGVPPRLDGVAQKETLELLEKNSAAAAAAIRALSDEDLSAFAPISLYSDTPLTCQFMLEDHAVRHSWHHLARLRKVLKR
jgi:hypothetical protein